MVPKSAVARWWRFSLGEAAMSSPPVIKTGAPGRPTSIHLVEAEHRARWDRDEAEIKLSAEAEKLAAWLKSQHPDVPQLKPKTIANRLRHEHRKRVADARN
jgi:hypothetical protein